MAKQAKKISVKSNTAAKKEKLIKVTKALRTEQDTVKSFAFPTAESMSAPFPEGSRVVHKKFGGGTVVVVEKSGAVLMGTLLVRFDKLAAKNPKYEYTGVATSEVKSEPAKSYGGKTVKIGDHVEAEDGYTGIVQAFTESGAAIVKYDAIHNTTTEVSEYAPAHLIHYKDARPRKAAKTKVLKSFDGKPLKLGDNILNLNVATDIYGKIVGFDEDCVLVEIIVDEGVTQVAWHHLETKHTKPAKKEGKFKPVWKKGDRVMHPYYTEVGDVTEDSTDAGTTEVHFLLANKTVHLLTSLLTKDKAPKVKTVQFQEIGLLEPFMVSGGVNHTTGVFEGRTYVKVGNSTAIQIAVASDSFGTNVICLAVRGQPFPAALKVRMKKSDRVVVFPGADKVVQA